MQGNTPMSSVTIVLQKPHVLYTNPGKIVFKILVSEDNQMVH